MDKNHQAMIKFEFKKIELNEIQDKKLRAFPTTIDGLKNDVIMIVQNIYFKGQLLDCVKVRWYESYQPQLGVTLFLPISQFNKIINN
ncbi:MAG: hypothetical protein Q4A15_02715 [Prevotellaceae bacterium]|nr:hypothetical protein [Prevotellaceae bacterium]